MTLNILPQKYMNLVINIPNSTDALKNPCMLQISEKERTSYQKVKSCLGKMWTHKNRLWAERIDLSVRWCVHSPLHLELPTWQWDSHNFPIHSRIKGAGKKNSTTNVATLLRRKMLYRMRKDTLQNLRPDRSLLLLFLLRTIYCIQEWCEICCKRHYILLIVSKLLMRKTENWNSLIFLL